MMIRDEDNKVLPIFGCPKCGEDDADQLVFTDENENTVECKNCHWLYMPGVGPLPGSVNYILF